MCCFSSCLVLPGGFAVISSCSQMVSMLAVIKCGVEQSQRRIPEE